LLIPHIHQSTALLQHALLRRKRCAAAAACMHYVSLVPATHAHTHANTHTHTLPLIYTRTQTHCHTHAQAMLTTINMGNPIAVFCGFAVFAAVTFGVLLCMDVLECFLHALRLHWVRRQLYTTAALYY
jgi:V-type ATPase 116kDa subunit family